MTRKPQQPSRDELFLAALAAGDTATRAARRAGFSRATATRRLADPAFRKRVRNERARLLEQASAMLAGSASEAVMTLRNQLTSESDAIRLSAAKAILDSAVRLRDATELESRLAAIEGKLGGSET